MVVALSPGGPKTAQTGGRGRVVLVDHDGVFCAALGSALEGDGFEVATAADGPAARELVRRWSPDAIILGLNLADADGLACLLRLRAMGPVGQLPVVILTPQEGEEHQLRGREMGADRLLTKPVDMEMLAWHLDELLARPSHARVNPLAGLRQQPTIPLNLV